MPEVLWGARAERATGRLGGRGLGCLAAAFAVVAASCRSEAPLPAAPPVIEVTTKEYKLSHSAQPRRGRVVFRFHNVGRLHHGPVLIPLPDDMPPIAEQLKGSERRSLLPLAGIAPSPPGSRRSMAVDMRPGRYAFLCVITDDDGRSHAIKGMAMEFRVQ